jgi:hypothetical protein
VDTYLRSVVQYCVDTLAENCQCLGSSSDCETIQPTYSPLLEEHGDRSQSDAAQHGLRLEQRSGSHELQLNRRPGRAICQVWEVFGYRALFEHRLRFDL